MQSFSLHCESRFANCRRIPAAALVLALLSAASLGVEAQTRTFSAPPKPAPGAPRAQLQLQGVNVTNWGIAERQGSKTHGKIGETLFVEGRDLDPTSLRAELRVGSRSAQLTRKAGGSSARVEFTIPAAAMSGELTGTLQVVGVGSTVLSDNFGVCQRTAIHTVFPSPLAFDTRQRDGNGDLLLTGTIMTLDGECLQELRFSSVRGKGAFSVGSGTVLIQRVRSQSHAKAEIELDRYIPPSRGLRSEGPMRQVVPVSGPTLVIDDVFVVNAAQQSAAPPPAAKLAPITIRAVESLTRFTPSGPLLPYVIVRPEAGSFVMNSRIRVSGDNLSTNPGTAWSLGSVSLMPPLGVAVQPDNLAVPPNAITGAVCATRSDGVRSCATQPTTVIAAPKITSVPAGWPKYGTPDESQRLSVRVRQTHTIRGFDLQPPKGLGLEAEVSVGNFAVAVAQRCNLDFRVQRFDATTISFSFGEPGGSRPADCSAQDEAALGFMQGTTPADLFLSWRHAGGGEQKLRWKLVGAP